MLPVSFKKSLFLSLKTNVRGMGDKKKPFDFLRSFVLSNVLAAHLYQNLVCGIVMPHTHLVVNIAFSIFFRYVIAAFHGTKTFGREVIVAVCKRKHAELHVGLENSPEKKNDHGA